MIIQPVVWFHTKKRYEIRIIPETEFEKRFMESFICIGIKSLKIKWERSSTGVYCIIVYKDEDDKKKEAGRGLRQWQEKERKHRGKT
jgi:hypothetical protein